MKAAVIIVLLFGIAHATTSNERTASVLCFDNGDNYTMVFTVERHQDLYLNFTRALDENDMDVPGCSSHPVETSPFTITGDNDLFEITINIVKATSFVDTNCGQTKNGLVYTWRFLTSQAETGIVKLNDIVFDVECDFNNASPLNVNSAVNVTGEPLQNLNPETLVSMLEVLDETDSMINLAVLGQSVKLRVTQIQGPPATITAYSCFAGPDAVFDEGPTEFELIDADGCPTQVSGEDYVSAPFVGGSPSSSSGQFEQFLFTGSNSVYYRCLVRYCFDTDTSCNNLCQFNAGRRKRQADVTGPESVETSVKVIVGSSSVQGTDVSDSDTGPASRPATNTEEKAESCLDNVGVIAAFAVLGALLVVTIIVAVVLYFRSVKLSRWAEKERL